MAPASQVRKAHEPAEISSIAYSHVGDHLLTRSLDETLKLWDLRNFKKAVHTKGDLFARYDTTDAIFSPNDALVVTAMSLRRGNHLPTLLSNCIITFQEKPLVTFTSMKPALLIC